MLRNGELPLVAFLFLLASSGLILAVSSWGKSNVEPGDRDYRRDVDAIEALLAKQVPRPLPVIAEDRLAETASHGTFS